MAFITNKVRRASGNQLAEFAPAIILLITFLLMPSFVALYFMCGALVSYLAVSESAKSAALQDNYGAALAAAKNHAQKVSTTGLGQLLHLKNDEAEGAQLFIEVTNLKTSKITEFGPNTPLPGEVDPIANLYQVEARAAFRLGPLLPNAQTKPPEQGLQKGSQEGSQEGPLAGLPILNQPVHMCFRVRRPSEYPAGLSASHTQAAL